MLRKRLTGLLEQGGRRGKSRGPFRMAVSLWAPAFRTAPLHEQRISCLSRWQRFHDCRRAALVAAAATAGGASRSATGSSSSSATSPCHYEVLGLPRSATRTEIKRAFRRLARLWHPDVNVSPAASERFQVKGLVAALPPTGVHCQGRMGAEGSSKEYDGPYTIQKNTQG